DACRTARPAKARATIVRGDYEFAPLAPARSARAIRESPPLQPALALVRRQGRLESSQRSPRRLQPLLRPGKGVRDALGICCTPRIQALGAVHAFGFGETVARVTCAAARFLICFHALPVTVFRSARVPS